MQNTSFTLLNIEKKIQPRPDNGIKHCKVSSVPAAVVHYSNRIYLFENEDTKVKS